MNHASLPFSGKIAAYILQKNSTYLYIPIFLGELGLN